METGSLDSRPRYTRAYGHRPRRRVSISAESAAAVHQVPLGYFALSVPSRPWASPSGPEVKNTAEESAPGARASPHNPLITVGLPAPSRTKSMKVPVLGIVRPDPTISEIANQEIVAERAEAGRRHGHGPRRVQVALARESLGERAIWIEDVDVAVPEPWGVILIVRRQLLGEGDIQLASHGLNAERSVSCRHGGVGERFH